MTNMREFIREVTKREGKKRSMSIAQCGEVSKIVLEMLADMPMIEVQRLLKRYEKKPKRIKKTYKK